MSTAASSLVPARSVVQFILERAHAHDWTLQGLGMLRLYLPGGCRLHVWDMEHARNVGASAIHTHPWDFTSWVIAGKIKNWRMIEVDGPPGYVYGCRTVHCGKGLAENIPEKTVGLRPLEPH